MTDAMAGTVTVALKMPHGLILRTFDMVKTMEPVFGGGYREIEIARPTAQRVVVRGYAAPFGKLPAAPVVGQQPIGYALTPGVDADFFARWLKENADSDLVKNRLIFAYAKEADAVAAAKEHDKQRNGFEPIDPEAPPMEFRRITKADNKAA